MASVSDGRLACLRLLPGLTLVLVLEVVFGLDFGLAEPVLGFEVLRAAVLFGLAADFRLAAALTVLVFGFAVADFGLAAAFTVAALGLAELRLLAAVADLAALRVAVRFAAARFGFTRLAGRGFAGPDAAAAGLAVESVLAAVFSALAAEVIALVAVFIDCIAVDMVLADDVALVAAAVILPAADVTLVAADDTVRAATAGVGEILAVRRAVLLRAAVLRVLRGMLPRELRAVVLRELRAVVLFELGFAAGRLGFAVVLRLALTPVVLVLGFDFMRLADFLAAAALLDLARVLLAVLRRAAAWVVV